MVQIVPTKVGDLGKRILLNISKYIVEKVNQTEDEDEMTTSFFDGHFTLLPDEPHIDPEISADTRVKVKFVLIEKENHELIENIFSSSIFREN